MFQATEKERDTAVKVIAKTFLENPSVNIVIGNGGDRKKKITRLAHYAYIKSLNREGAFLSDNRKGVALCFRSDEGGTNLRELWYEMVFAFSIPFANVRCTLKRESYIKKHRIAGPYLYFWFLGVEKESEGAVHELKKFFFDWSERESLPIILVTSVFRNRTIYERFGFKVYHTWPDSGNDIPLWFMIKEPV